MLTGYLKAGIRDDNTLADPFDQFTTATSVISSTSHTPQPQVNPYAQDSNGLGLASYYQTSNSFTHPGRSRLSIMSIVYTNVLSSFSIIFTLPLARIENRLSQIKERHEIFSYRKTCAKCSRKRAKLRYRPFQVNCPDMSTFEVGLS